MAIRNASIAVSDVIAYSHRLLASDKSGDEWNMIKNPSAGFGEQLGWKERLGQLGLVCSVESDDGTGIAISEGAIISLAAVKELDRST
jgi:hypothetical protein